MPTIVQNAGYRGPGRGTVDPATGVDPEDDAINSQEMGNDGSAVDPTPAEQKQQQEDPPSPHTRSEAIYKQIRGLMGQRQASRFNMGADMIVDKQIHDLQNLYAHVSQQENQDQANSRFLNKNAFIKGPGGTLYTRDLYGGLQPVPGAQAQDSPQVRAAALRGAQDKAVPMDLPGQGNVMGYNHPETGKATAVMADVPGSSLELQGPTQNENGPAGLGYTPNRQAPVRPYEKPQYETSKTEQVFQQPGGGVIGVTPGGGARNINLPPGAVGPLQKVGAPQNPNAQTPDQRGALEEKTRADIEVEHMRQHAQNNGIDLIGNQLYITALQRQKIANQRYSAASHPGGAAPQPPGQQHRPVQNTSLPDGTVDGTGAWVKQGAFWVPKQ